MSWIGSPRVAFAALVESFGEKSEGVSSAIPSCGRPAILVKLQHEWLQTVQLIRLAGPVPRLRKPFSDGDLFGAIRTALSA